MAQVATMEGEQPDVRFEDQEKINEFGKLNNRLLELRAEIVQHKADAEKLEDANAELMMASGDKVMLLIGQCFLEVDEDYATSYCEKKQATLDDLVATLSEEEALILGKQKALKKELYGRFKDSINLEN